MKGQISLTMGYVGWGNPEQSASLVAYGPGGRWGGPGPEGDLLGPYLATLGCNEGSPFIVIASDNRFDESEMRELRALLHKSITDFINRDTT